MGLRCAKITFTSRAAGRTIHGHNRGLHGRLLSRKAAGDQMGCTNTEYGYLPLGHTSADATLVGYTGRIRGEAMDCATELRI